MTNIDPKYIGIPNICFSLTASADDREPNFAVQRTNIGFDDSETWSLRDTIGKFILPRLKRFREIHAGYPMELTSDQWEGLLDKMIRSFELLTQDGGIFCLSETEMAEYTEGQEIFSKWYLNLWW